MSKVFVFRNIDMVAVLGAKGKKHAIAIAKDQGCCVENTPLVFTAKEFDNSNFKADCAEYIAYDLEY